MYCIVGLITKDDWKQVLKAGRASIPNLVKKLIKEGRSDDAAMATKAIRRASGVGLLIRACCGEAYEAPYASKCPVCKTGEGVNSLRVTE